MEKSPNVYEGLIAKSELCHKAATEANCQWMRDMWMVKSNYLKNLAQSLPRHIAQGAA